MDGLELPPTLPLPRRPSPAVNKPAAARATGLDLPGDLPSPTVNAVLGASASRQRTSSPALDLPRDLPFPGGSGSSDARISQLEQELKMAKDEQDVRVDREVEVLQRFLKKQHQEALAGVVSQLAEVTAALQAEQSKYQAMEKDDSDFRKKAQGAIKDWKTAYVALQGQLADAQEQLQQQGTMQPNSPFSTSQPFSTSAPAAELAMMTKDNEALRQEVQRLQQEAAVKAEDTAAQQLLGEAQTQLELAKMDVKSLNAKLEASEAKQAEMAGKLEAAKSNFDSTFSQLRADVVEHARQYAVDISEKDKEIKSLKERGSNHRSSNRSKKSSHSQDGTQEKHRA